MSEPTVEDLRDLERGDLVESFCTHPLWQHHLVPFLEHHRLEIRDACLAEAGTDTGLPRHRAAFYAGQEQMIETLVSTLAAWRQRRADLLATYPTLGA